MRIQSLSYLVLSCLILVSCASPPKHDHVKFHEITQIAYGEYEGNDRHKAFAIGESGGSQVFGSSYEWGTAHKAAEMAMSECRKSYQAHIGGSDNCTLYSVNDRRCEKDVDCVPSPDDSSEALTSAAMKAFEEYQGYSQYKAFAIGGSDDYQVWGFSRGTSTEPLAIDVALAECRKFFKSDIGGPDNCALYAVGNRVCDGLCLY